jgi:formylglycine-generating enzyme required for sulfatase activity
MPPRLALRLLSLFAVLLLLVLALPGPAQPGGGRKHALLVGVRDYDSAKLDPLKYTENDVEELARVLTEQAGFASVRLLSTSRAGGGKNRRNAPTGANLRAELKALLAQRKRNDVVLVALAGHGIQATVKGKEESFFCPSDAQLNDPKTLLGLSDLLAELDGSGAGTKLLLVDACRNDPTLGRGLTAPSLLPRGTAALCSCKSGERAFESPKLGKGHGIFFFHVIDGLRGKARNKRGEVTWSSLADHVIDKVSDDVPRLIGGGARQTPEQKLSLTGRSPVLVPSRASRMGKVVVNSVGMKLVRIPRGKFLMGSPEKEQEDAFAALGKDAAKLRPDRFRGERPQHEVEISQPYWLGMHEVTQRQFQAVMGYNPSFFSADGKGKPGAKYQPVKPADGKDKVKGLDTADFPVEMVSWNEAVGFCEKLSDLEAEKKAGRAYRLPTEAQWEHACRARTKTPFHVGSALSTEKANFGSDGKEKGALGRTCKVGSYAPNAFGLFDMHGNVMEWCADLSNPEYYARSPRLDPPGSSVGAQRAIRGGSWARTWSYCRSAARFGALPGRYANGIGFRVVLVPAD